MCVHALFQQGSFFPERVARVAQSLLDHMTLVAENAAEEQRKVLGTVTLEGTSASLSCYGFLVFMVFLVPSLAPFFTPHTCSLTHTCVSICTGVLSNIHVYRVFDYLEQLAVIRLLPEFLATHPEVQTSLFPLLPIVLPFLPFFPSRHVSRAPHSLTHSPPITSQVKLIVLDSVAFHFRRDFDDMHARSRLLHSMGNVLHEVVAKYKLAVVVMNQVRLTDRMERH